MMWDSDLQSAVSMIFEDVLMMCQTPLLQPPPLPKWLKSSKSKNGKFRSGGAAWCSSIFYRWIEETLADNTDHIRGSRDHGYFYAGPSKIFIKFS